MAAPEIRAPQSRTGHALFAGTGRLTGAVMKREVSYSIIWIVCLVAMTLVGPWELLMLYGDTRALQNFVTILKIPAMVAMLGPVFAKISQASYAVISTNEMLLISLVLVAIMNCFYVVRQTRKDEEQGNLEIVRSLPVGRLANLASTLLGAVMINVVLGICVTVSLVALHAADASYTFAGALSYGLAFVVCGLVFAGLAALIAQLASTARGANTISMCLLGAFYLMRAFGDIKGSWRALSYISPLGLPLFVKPYLENTLWPLLVLLAVAIVLIAVAFVLAQARDLDAGLIPTRDGFEHAPAWLCGNFGLVWRQMRNQLIGWAIVMVLVGVSYGSFLGVIDNFLKSNKFFARIMPPVAGFSTAQVFLSLLMVVFALVACIPPLLLVLKLHSEEFHGHLEFELTTPLRRARVFADYLIYAFVTSLVMVLITAVALWITNLAVMPSGEAMSFWSTLKLIGLYLPAIWAMIGFAAVLVGAAPTRTIGAWSYLAVGFYATYLGRVFLKNTSWSWVIKISPFGWIPEYPLDPIHIWPLVILTLIAVALTAVGVYSFGQRDLEIG